MNYKDLNTTQINTFQSLFSINKDNYQTCFDNSYEEDLNCSKNLEDNANNNINKTINASIKDIKNNKIDSSFKSVFGISNFNFFIKNKKDEKDLNNLKAVNSIKIKINKINNKEYKKRGRKRIREEISNNDNNTKAHGKTHDKFCDDNMRKKCKNIILKYALEFINDKIKEKYKDDIGHGRFKKELKIINQGKKINSTVNFDKSFLGKTLKDIFSEDISSRIINFPKIYNKTLIESIINDEDIERRLFFTKLFNITFEECLEYFREDEIIFKDELEGFKKFSSIKDELINQHEKEYVDLFFHYLQNLKEIINKKKPRKKKLKCLLIK